MTLAAEPAHPTGIPVRYLRMEVEAVPTEPAGGRECGATSYARDLAASLCHTLDGATWQAVTRYRYEPHPLVEQRSEILVMVDGRHLVAVSHRCPPGTIRDLWTIRVNGRAIAHRTHPREVPHSVEAISRSVWRHRHDIAVDGCDTLGCHGPANVATWAHRSMCRNCARQFALTGQ